MKISRKLYLGFGSLLIVMTIFMAVQAVLLDRIHDDTKKIVNDRVRILRLLNKIQNDLNSSEAILTELVVGGKYNEGVRSELDKISFEVATTFDSLQRLAVTSDVEALVSNISEVDDIITRSRLMNKKYVELQEKILEQSAAGNNAEASYLFFHEGKNLRMEMIQIMAETRELYEKRTNAVYSSFEQTILKSNQLIYVTVISSFIIGLAFVYWFVGNFNKSLKQLIGALNGIAYGQKDNLPRLEVKGNNEFKEIADAVNEMAAAIEEQAKTEKQFLQTMEDQNWLNLAVAEISVLSQGVQNFDTMSSLLINKITPMAGASYGAFYIRDFLGDPQCFKKYAAYADTAGEPGVERIKVGEGLIGQCISENKTIILPEVPENYIKISSGLGHTLPASIIIMPIEFEGQAVGAIELATLDQFTELHMTLLQQVLANIGIVIHGIKSHLTIQGLLEESKALTEELQSQAEELQSQQEELRSMNEELQEQNRCSEERAEELEKIKTTLEEKTRQLTLTSKYKSEFLANMSHELRTPLNSLLILAQLLKENPDGNLDDKQVEYAGAMYSSGNDLLGLINTILDLSKIESGKMNVEMGELFMDELETFIRSQFSAVAEQKGIKLDVRLDENIPTAIYTDEQKLKQILNNLLSNAIKFTEYGSVILDIKSVDDQTLAMSVIDTGIGISRDKVHLIFESFSQADGTTSRKYGGTGLGLSISKELAQLLGGHIEVETAEGEGSTFTLYLPIGDLIEQDFSSEEEAACGSYEMPSLIQPVEAKEVHGEIMQDGDKELLDGKKILIVDDDMRNVFALTTVLERHNMIVLFAENGRESIEILEENPDIDLILMDIMMPEMDGYETIGCIRQMPEYKQLPIIAVTAKAMKGDRQKCIDAGASDYISKPINIEQLYSLILVWLCK